MYVVLRAPTCHRVAADSRHAGRHPPSLDAAVATAVAAGRAAAATAADLAAGLTGAHATFARQLCERSRICSPPGQLHRLCHQLLMFAHLSALLKSAWILLEHGADFEECMHFLRAWR